jgi:RNA polymerase sigma-70 factor (family 1)
MDGSAKTTVQEERFKTLFDLYKKPVHDYIRKITGSHEVAEEITQVVFIRFWKRMGSYDQIENIDYYIFRIARNECMRYFKKAAVETQLFKELQLRMTTGSNNITEYINYRETEAILNKAIASLSPKRQKVYLLSRRQGFRMEEIAAEMKLSYNTVRNHLVEALRQIRKYYLQHFPSIILLIFSFITL